MSESQERSAPESKAEGGCLGALLALAFWSVLWLGVCFLLYWKVGANAAAVAFFVPPVLFMLWAQFTKPPGRDLDPRP